jgi:hypothetical protein
VVPSQPIACISRLWNSTASLKESLMKFLSLPNSQKNFQRTFPEGSIPFTVFATVANKTSMP